MPLSNLPADLVRQSWLEITADISFQQVKCWPILKVVKTQILKKNKRLL